MTQQTTTGRFNFGTGLNLALMNLKPAKKKTTRATKRKIRKTNKWQFRIGSRNIGEVGEDVKYRTKPQIFVGKRYSAKNDPLCNWIPRVVGETKFRNSNNPLDFNH